MLFAQEDKKMKFSTERYKSDWEKVTADESKGLPKSALEKVNAIYKKAKEDNNPSQSIKAVIHKVKYIGQVEEDAFAKALEELQKETESATSYAKPVLHSILGEVYWQYYNNNRYYIMQRTKTDKFKQSDLRTWDATKLIEASIAEYTAAIKERLSEVYPNDIQKLVYKMARKGTIEKEGADKNRVYFVGIKKANEK